MILVLNHSQYTQMLIFANTPTTINSKPSIQHYTTTLIHFFCKIIAFLLVYIQKKLYLCSII